MESLGRSINSGNGSNGIEYLNMNSIPEFRTVERVAYVHDVSLGVTKLEDGFVKFYLKDCNANLTTAVMFGVEEFALSGMKATAFKHKPIKFKCVAQEFKGRLSLVIDGASGVSLYDGPFEYEKFIGVIKSDCEFMKNTMGDCGIEFNSANFIEWTKTPLEEIGRGRIGGYAKVAEIAFAECYRAGTLLPPEELKSFLSVFNTVSDFYFRYIKKRQTLEIIDTLNAYPFMTQIAQKLSDDDTKTLCMDAFSALVGIDTPKHLFAHLIEDAFNTAKKSLVLILQYEAMPLGSKNFVGGVELSKY